MRETPNGYRYGVWAGNPKGHPRDPARCIQAVWSGGRGSLEHQCNRKPTHGEYCAQHQPERAARARVKVDAAGRLRYEQDVLSRCYGGAGAVLMAECIMEHRDLVTGPVVLAARDVLKQAAAVAKAEAAVAALEVS